MGMDPADDPDGANPRGHYGGSREEATEELEIEIGASEDVELLQTTPSPQLPSPLLPSPLLKCWPFAPTAGGADPSTRTSPLRCFPPVPPKCFPL